MVTYKGLPTPIICDCMSRDASQAHYSEGTTFHIGKVEMVANTGTYIDAPYHRFADGQDIAGLDLAAVANREGRIFRSDPAQRAIDPSLFNGAELKGKAVLIHTGWAQHWGSEQYFDEHPYLTKDAADFLSAAGVAVVGIDSLNIDDTRDGNRPVHTQLLANGIPIVEHLCHLEQVPDTGFRFFAVPTKIKGLGSFPVRAFCLVDEDADRVEM